jgi:hypothetical protein
MSKDSLALERHAWLEGSSNYHLWKHMITWAINKEGLWFILKEDPNKGKGAAPSNLDEKNEYLLYKMRRMNICCTRWEEWIFVVLDEKNEYLLY